MFGYKTVITIDEKGRIVIPSKVREELGVIRGDMMALEYQDGVITLFVVDKEKLFNKGE